MGFIGHGTGRGNASWNLRLTQTKSPPATASRRRSGAIHGRTVPRSRSCRVSPIAGAEHRQTIAHGVSRGTRVPTDHQPQGGDRRGRGPCSASTIGEGGFRTRKREDAKEPEPCSRVEQEVTKKPNAGGRFLGGRAFPKCLHGRILTLPPHGTGWRRPRRRSKAIPKAMRTSPPRILSKRGQCQDAPRLHGGRI
jgi:hypothetical protein